ncbi:MAG: hypothetical protein MHMPM18_003883 [Marteilia pararefringens]
MKRDTNDEFLAASNSSIETDEFTKDGNGAVISAFHKGQSIAKRLYQRNASNCLSVDGKRMPQKIFGAALRTFTTARLLPENRSIRMGKVGAIKA